MSLQLDAPLFPGRHWVDDRARALAEATTLAGTAATYRAKGTVAALEIWTRGGSFHRYGVTALDALIAEGMSVEDALRQIHECPARLKFTGDLRSSDRGIWWSVWYQRVGVSDDNGGSSGYSTLEDCAYAALTLIEEREREVYEGSLVLGLA